MRVYISGPISLGGTATQEQIAKNLGAFEIASKLLAAMGHQVVSPRDNEGKASNWVGYMRIALGQLVTCDAIYLLPNWQSSKGCVLEVAVAEGLGMPEVKLELDSTGRDRPR